MLRIISFLLLLLTFLQNNVFGQKSIQDSIQNIATVNMIGLYTAEAKKRLHLFNGREYNGYSPTIQGFPFFLSEELQNGWVVYDGLLYENVPMKFDIYQELVLIKPFENFKIISLVKEKIKSFSITDHTFVHIEKDSSINPLPNGFYEMLYKGPTTVTSKRTKKMQMLPSGTESRFDENDIYYIKNKEGYIIVRNLNSLLEALGDRKNEVKRYLKKNRIRFKKNKQNAIVKAAAYYDSLKK